MRTWCQTLEIEEFMVFDELNKWSTVKWKTCYVAKNRWCQKCTLLLLLAGNEKHTIQNETNAQFWNQRTLATLRSFQIINGQRVKYTWILRHTLASIDPISSLEKIDDIKSMLSLAPIDIIITGIITITGHNMPDIWGWTSCIRHYHRFS